MDSQAASGNGGGGPAVTRGSFGVVPAGERRDQRATWHGFSNALRAGGRARRRPPSSSSLLGLWLDGRLGTRPLFTVVLGSARRRSGSACDQLLPVPAADRARRGREAVDERNPVAPAVEREVALDIVKRGLIDRARRSSLVCRPRSRLGRRRERGDRDSASCSSTSSPPPRS